MNKQVTRLLACITVPFRPAGRTALWDLFVSAIFVLCPSIAARVFHWTAAQGDVSAQSNLGLLHSMGRGVHKDMVEAAKWYRAAAHQGDETAQCALGCMHLAGDGVPKDSEEACYWFTEAAEQDDEEAQYRLGCMHLTGDGVPRNDTRAAGWFRKAGQQGHLGASAILVIMQYSGQLIPGIETQDFGVMCAMIKQAAGKGDAEAQFLHGLMFDYGVVSERDSAEAAIWYRMAAEQGHAKAQLHLGTCFHSGDGTEKDDDEAVRWYRLAAEQGHAEAQYCLGACFRCGAGVPQDYDEALALFRTAAVNGGDLLISISLFMKCWSAEEDGAECLQRLRMYAEEGEVWAQFCLGRIYAGPENTENLSHATANSNPVHAYAWLCLAAEQGLEAANSFIAELDSLMVPSQIAAAHSMAQDLKEATGKQLSDCSPP